MIHGHIKPLGKPGLVPGFFARRTASFWFGDPRLGNLRADLRERGGNLARLRQHEEVGRLAGAIGQHRRLTGTVGIDLHGINGDAGGHQLSHSVFIRVSTGELWLELSPYRSPVFSPPVNRMMMCW
jgi:hypothetical protein